MNCVSLLLILYLNFVACMYNKFHLYSITTWMCNHLSRHSIFLYSVLYHIVNFPFCQLSTSPIPTLSTFHFVNSHFANFPLRQFPLCQLPTSSIPTLSIPILTKWELTKWEDAVYFCVVVACVCVYVCA